MKGREGQEKEMGEWEDNQQAINILGGADHKGFKAQVHFMLLKHDLNFPAAGVMGQNLLIRKIWIRTQEQTQGLPFSE